VHARRAHAAHTAAAKSAATEPAGFNIGYRGQKQGEERRSACEVEPSRILVSTWKATWSFHIRFPNA